MFKNPSDLGLMDLKVMLTAAGFPIPAGKDDPRVLRLLRSLDNHGVRTTLSNRRVNTTPSPIAGEIILKGVGGPCTLGTQDG